MTPSLGSGEGPLGYVQLPEGGFQVVSFRWRVITAIRSCQGPIRIWQVTYSHLHLHLVLALICWSLSRICRPVCAGNQREMHVRLTTAIAATLVVGAVAVAGGIAHRVPLGETWRTWFHSFGMAMACTRTCLGVPDLKRQSVSARAVPTPSVMRPCRHSATRITGKGTADAHSTISL